MRRNKRSFPQGFSRIIAARRILFGECQRDMAFQMELWMRNGCAQDYGFSKMSVNTVLSPPPNPVPPATVVVI